MTDAVLNYRLANEKAQQFKCVVPCHDGYMEHGTWGILRPILVPGKGVFVQIMGGVNPIAPVTSFIANGVCVFVGANGHYLYTPRWVARELFGKQQLAFLDSHAKWGYGQIGAEQLEKTWVN